MSSTDKKKTAIIVGAGGGGAVMAEALQGKYHVLILEKGNEFKPFSGSIPKYAGLRKSGLFLDERLISTLVPNMKIDKNKNICVARGIGVGGTTTLATGNMARADESLRELGIDLNQEFEELYKEIPITTEHQKNWCKATRDMFAVFEEMGLDPIVTPKALDAARCVHCGHCAIGCPPDAKWDARELVDRAVENGAKLLTGCTVTGLEISDNAVTGVHTKVHGKKKTFRADLVILAAGGLGTPVILENSGISCPHTLFVDPVLCVAGPLPDFHQERDLLMAFISRQDGYILSPYVDYLSFFFNKEWRMPLKDVACIMIKLADSETGRVTEAGMEKALTAKDKITLQKAVLQCREILSRLGVPEDQMVLGTLNGGHPGGMLPLTAAEKDTLHSPLLPENLYVADATILPKAPGFPPLLTIMALAKKMASLL